MEVGKRGLGEAGADLARVAQSVAIEGADQQGAEMLAGAAGGREAADHELLLRAHLHLAPRRRALARPVGGARVLADDALEPATPRLGERLQPVVGQTARDPEDRSLPHLRLEHRAPGGQGLAQEVTAARVQAVEDDVDGRGSAGSATLQQLKARDAAGVEHDDLAVEHECGCGQRGDRRGHVGKIFGPVLVVAGDQLDAAALLAGDQANAIVFLLPHPAGAVEGHVHQRGEHRRKTRRRRARGGHYAMRRPARGGSAPAASSSWRGVAPAARAMPAIVRRDTTESGRFRVTSSVETKRSRCLMRSHWRLRVRTSTHEPRSLLPWSANLRSPLARAAVTSATSGIQTPRSQIITVPPPYSPSGMTPSKPL